MISKLSLTTLLSITVALCAADCTNYLKLADNLCAQTCLGSTTGICPASIIVKYGGLEEGTCADLGYTKDEGEIEQKAGPCGTLKFTKYSKPTTLLQSNQGSDSALILALSQLEFISLDDEQTETRALSDDDCKWSLTEFACVDKNACSFQFRFGDLSLDQSCRLKTEKSTCDAIELVSDLDPAQYFSGRWFEIATTNSFRSRAEKGLSCISADYSFNKCAENPVVVTNSGINEDGESKVAVGKARPGPSGGKFEVSFFGPFFAPYWVIHVESTPEHQYAVAIVVSCSKSGQTMWFLSRTPQLPESTSSYDQLLEIARQKGVDVDSLDNFSPSDQHEGCVYPEPETLNPVPESDDGCSFGIFGCEPSSWCSFQFRWGDLTPSQSCRLKPTDCDGPTNEESSKVTRADAKETSDPVSPVVAAIGGAAVGVAATVAIAVFVSTRHRKIALPTPNPVDMYTRC